MPEAQRRLADGLAALGLSHTLAPPLLAYLDLLAHWNRRFNLTAVRDPAQAVTRHLLDSLAALPHLAGPRLLDLGSGAGLPGVPVALARLDWEVVLLERNGKKARFLTQVALTLPLANVTVVQVDAGRYRPAAGFDTITARAVAELSPLLRQARPLLAPGGQLVALKGRYPEAEMAALDSADVSWVCHALAVPGLDAPRHAVVVRPAAGV